MLRRTPLHRALYWGNFGAAARLLEAGASVNVADHKVPGSRRSLTTVCLACKAGSHETPRQFTGRPCEWHCLECVTLTPP